MLPNITPEDEVWAGAHLDQIESLMIEVFFGKQDRAGAPYVFHLMRVATKQTTKVRKVLALLHDLFEDTDKEEQCLRDCGVPESIIARVSLLTRRPEQSYEDYINQILTDLDCTYVKQGDLEDNMQVHRLPEFGRSEFQLMKRYHMAYQMIKDKLSGKHLTREERTRILTFVGEGGVFGNRDGRDQGGSVQSG